MAGPGAELVIALRAETASLRTGLNQVRNDLQSLKRSTDMNAAAVEGMGRKFGGAARQMSYAAEQMARSGKVAGEGLRMLVSQGAEMAFFFGTAGPIVGAVAVTGIAVANLFRNMAKESEEAMKKMRNDARAIASMSLEQSGAESRRLYGGDPYSDSEAERIGVGQLRALKQSQMAAIGALGRQPEGEGAAAWNKRNFELTKNLQKINAWLDEITPKYERVFGQFQRTAGAHGAGLVGSVIPMPADGSARGMLPGIRAIDSGGGAQGSIVPNAGLVPQIASAGGDGSALSAWTRFKGSWSGSTGGGGVLGGLKEAGSSLLGMLNPTTAAFALLGPVLKTLTPLFEAFAPVLKIVTDVVSVLGQVVATVASWIMKSVGGLLTGIGKLLNLLPGSIGNPLIRAGAWMTNFGEGLADAAAEMKRARNAQAELTQTTQALNHELRNAPASFRYALVRHAVLTGATAATIGGGMLPPPAAPGRQRPRDEGFANFGTIIIETLHVDAQFMQSLGTHAQRSANRGGTTRTRRGIGER